MTCFLIHADANHHLSPGDEAKRYLLHTNGPHDPGYVRFLEQALVPARDFLKAGGRALDYGCGPSPVLPVLLECSGVACDRYDPTFFPGPPARERYEIVFATECVEHFRAPAEDWQHLLSFLRAGGHLVLMTELWRDPEAFRSWAYARDLTHVAFYHTRTLDWIAAARGLTKVHADGKRVTVFRAGGAEEGNKLAVHGPQGQGRTCVEIRQSPSN